MTCGAVGEKVTPFEMKGGRQARIVAEAIVEHEGVPPNFARAIRRLAGWIEGGCPGGGGDPDGR